MDDTKAQLLLQLAERCETEEPSEALNEAIADAVDKPDAAYGHSLDAAVTLAPEVGGMNIYDRRRDGPKRVVVVLYQSEWVGITRAFGPTIPLALCAAALRALASLQERGQ